MNNTERFPAELLNRSKKEQIEYFENLTIAHPNLTHTFEKLQQTLSFTKPGAVILVFGPTGVGKTTLLNHAGKKITEEKYEELQSDLVSIPCIKVEAAMPTKGVFNWKDLFQDMLEELNEPCSLDTLIRRRNIAEPTLREILAGRKGTDSKFRLGVEKALKYRKTEVVFVDEGQHITVLASARKLLDQQNTIKSIANRSKTKYVLFGNYDLLLLRNLNGQLSRRTYDIHIKNYDFEKDVDKKAFRNIIWMFQNHIPVKKTPELVPSWEYLYERSIGCVGILKEWFDRAVKLMMNKDSQVFSVKHLNATALPTIKCQKIASEILETEAKLVLEEEELLNLRSLLKMDKRMSAPPESDLDHKSKNSARGVGVRKAGRDPIGKK